MRTPVISTTKLGTGIFPVQSKFFFPRSLGPSSVLGPRYPWFTRAGNIAFTIRALHQGFAFDFFCNGQIYKRKMSGAIELQASITFKNEFFQDITHLKMISNLNWVVGHGSDPMAMPVAEEKQSWMKTNIPMQVSKIYI